MSAREILWVDVEERVEADPRYPDLRAEVDAAEAAVAAAHERRRQAAAQMEALRTEVADALGWGRK